MRWRTRSILAVGIASAGTAALLGWLLLEPLQSKAPQSALAPHSETAPVPALPSPAAEKGRPSYHAEKPRRGGSARLPKDVLTGGSARLPVEPQMADSVDQVEKALRTLDWGNIAFNAPESMTHGEANLVELVLSPSFTTADLEGELQKNVDVQVARVKLSGRMEAKLTAEDLAVEALTPDIQAVTRTGVTRWKWEVTPTKVGLHELHLWLSAYIDIAGSETPLVVKTFDRRIQVDISVSKRVFGFVGQNWQWLWAAMLAPAAGYWWKRRGKRGAKNPEPRPEIEHTPTPTPMAG